MTRSSVRLAGNPFRAAWDDFELFQAGDGFGLRFREAGTGIACRFRIIADKPALDVGPLLAAGDAAGAMSARLCSRLRLQGRRGRAAVSGRAWFEHQWGDPGLPAVPPADGSIRAWDRLSIQFGNGMDWLVFVLKDARTMSPSARFILTIDAGGKARFVRDFRLEPSAWWESPRTGVRYPVAWELDVPELDAKLAFRPLTDDQEILLPGVHRTVWEGAGEATGRIGKGRVKGAARGSFLGYGAILDVRAYFRVQARRVDRTIADFLPKESRPSDLGRLAGSPRNGLTAAVYQDLLARPTWDLLSRGGKRWRPLFALTLLDALGATTDAFDQYFCVMAELCHTGALIIDDIQDSSRLRRGGPCIHLGYGLDAAISAANTLYFLPALLIKDHPGLDDRRRLAMHEIFVRQMVRAHFGQSLDLHWSRRLGEAAVRAWPEDLRTGRILAMYALKTGALLEGLAEMCAVAAAAGPDLRAACRGFARALGVGFQILDDIHGYGRSSDWKKVRGEDIAEGKKTYVLARAIAALPARDRGRLAAFVGRKDLRGRSEAREAVLELVRRSGALAACRDEARTLVAAAWKTFRRRLPPSDARARLALLSTDLMEMDFD
ncbi:MAG: polyprenyl synthetase family protein [Candidatus Aminicenantes bacterium]|nr:polyprenyl synthetase family protein [Candidatus Aminicenantes bacterium]